jgi:hypothetical protein
MYVKGPTGQITVDHPESGIMGKFMVNTYLAKDFKILIISL